MIKETVTAEAMLLSAKAIADGLSIKFIADGESESDLATTAYIKEKLLTNSNQTIGLGASSSDIQYPIYQLNVYTPKAQSRFDNLRLVESVISQYSKAQFIGSGEQKVQVQTIEQSEVMLTESHLLTVISINLTVFANN